MNLEAASYIAQIVAGMSVVASLIFVGVQIRQSNAAARAATYQSLIQSLRDVQMVLVTDRSVLEALVAANAAPEAVRGVDKALMRQWNLQHLACFGDFHRQWSGGFVPPGLWEQMREGIVPALESPFVRQEWPWLRPRIDTGFIAWAEREVPSLVAKRAASDPAGS